MTFADVLLMWSVVCLLIGISFLVLAERTTASDRSGFELCAAIWSVSALILSVASGL